MQWSADIDDRSDRADRFARRFQNNGLLKIERLRRFTGNGGSGATRTVSDKVNWNKTSRRKSFAPVTPDQYRATGRRLAEGLRVQATEDQS